MEKIVRENKFFKGLIWGISLSIPLWILVFYAVYKII